jgi:hypothetical protein
MTPLEAHIKWKEEKAAEMERLREEQKIVQVVQIVREPKVDENIN